MQTDTNIKQNTKKRINHLEKWFDTYNNRKKTTVIQHPTRSEHHRLMCLIR